MSCPRLRPLACRRKLTSYIARRLIGFLLGTTLVGGYGYFQLLDDYSQASSLLLLSVEELKLSTEQVRVPATRTSVQLSKLTRRAPRARAPRWQAISSESSEWRRTWTPSSLAPVPKRISRG